MKVYIGPYIKKITPWKLARMLFFWKKEKMTENDFVDHIGDFFAWGFNQRTQKQSLLHRFLNALYDNKNRKVSVKIDEYDVWNMDHTLSLIILPMLKKLKEKNHGGPYVELEDVPEKLYPPEDELQRFKEGGYTDKNFFKRWEYVLDEMIWAFEKIKSDDIYFDVEEEQRVQRGTELFGKYFRNLWT